DHGDTGEHEARVEEECAGRSERTRDEVREHGTDGGNGDGHDGRLDGRRSRPCPGRPLFREVLLVLAVSDLEIRVGARTLMSGVSFRVAPGDKIGLVGRNGAGKTTLTKTLAGDAAPTRGTIERRGEVGYL